MCESVSGFSKGDFPQGLNKTKGGGRRNLTWFFASLLSRDISSHLLLTRDWHFTDSSSAFQSSDLDKNFTSSSAENPSTSTTTQPILHSKSVWVWVWFCVSMCVCVLFLWRTLTNKVTTHWLVKIATAVICVVHQISQVLVPGIRRSALPHGPESRFGHVTTSGKWMWVNEIYATSVLEDLKSIICSAFFFSMPCVTVMLLMAAALSPEVPANPWGTCRDKWKSCSFKPLRCGGCLLSQQNLTDPIIQVKEILFKAWVMKKTEPRKGLSEKELGTFEEQKGQWLECSEYSSQMWQGAEVN